MSQPFRILGLDHVVIRTGAPDRLERFYVEVLGCEVARRQDDIGLVQLRAGHSLIDLLATKDDPPAAQTGSGNMDHLCLRVEPFEAEAIRRHLLRHGCDSEPAALRYGADGRGLSIYLRDPAGNRIELKGPPLE